MPRLPHHVLACTTCDATLQSRIFGPLFGQDLAAVALPLLVGAILVTVGVHRWVAALEHDGRRLRAAPLASAGAMLGLGMGGFLDGIVLHQMLQWHQMMSSIVPPTTLAAKNYNMFWDGVFHVGTWTLTAIGIVMLFRLVGRSDVRRSPTVLLASALLGWGAFNVVDGTFNHYVFVFHAVREVTESVWAWNLGFLLVGVAQVLVGGTVLFLRVRERAAPRRERAPGVRAPEPAE